MLLFKVLRLSDRKKSSLWHKYPEFGFFKKKTEIKTILNPKIKELKDFLSRLLSVFLCISRLAGLGTQQTVEYITQLLSFWWYCFTKLAQVASTPLLIWHKWQQSNPEGSGLTKNLPGYLRAWCIWSWKMRIADRSFQSFDPFEGWHWLLNSYKSHFMQKNVIFCLITSGFL